MSKIGIPSNKGWALALCCNFEKKYIGYGLKVESLFI